MNKDPFLLLSTAFGELLTRFVTVFDRLSGVRARCLTGVTGRLVRAVYDYRFILEGSGFEGSEAGALSRSVYAYKMVVKDRLGGVCSLERSCSFS